MSGIGQLNLGRQEKKLDSRVLRFSVTLQILLVEDDESSQKLTTHFLVRNGMQVDIVTNAQDALSAISGIKYDVVLMDVKLPGINGLELTRLIREQETESNAWIMALTACAMPGDRKRCLEAGMDAYLSKPFSERELINLVQKLGYL